MKKTYKRNVKMAGSVGISSLLTAGLFYLLWFRAVSREIDEFDRRMKQYQIRRRMENILEK